MTHRFLALVLALCAQGAALLAMDSNLSVTLLPLNRGSVLGLAKSTFIP